MPGELNMLKSIHKKDRDKRGSEPGELDFLMVING